MGTKSKKSRTGVIKNRLINTSLLFVTTTIMLLLAEFAFRLILFSDIETFAYLRNPYYYSDHIKHKNEDFYNENYWKLNYLFNKSFNVKNPNPLLGWTGFFDKKTLDHRDHKASKGKRPVLLYGDSFAMCVDSCECFEDILNSDPEFASENYLLNYGVGGYGVDQIYLLFNETVDKYENPFVIFSLLTTDMDRSMLNVRDAQKPYFVLNDDGLELQGVPITLSSEEFFEQNSPDIKSYLWNKFKSSPLYPFSQNKKLETEYIEKIKTLNRAILTEAFKKLKELNTNYVVLIFHPVHLPRTGWRLTFLRELCYENKVPYICDLDVRNADRNYSKYIQYKYAVMGDGHPTTYSNVLISNKLKRYILDPEYREIEYYKYRILYSPEWLETVKLKAFINGIPLDSMIYLDAKYMADQDKD